MKKLSKRVQNLIGSGIIISDATQCVLELVYNALDADATSIAVRVNLTKFYIQVVDNGIGIDQCDLALVGKRYMTKHCISLTALEDNINSFGFRGSALASIVETSDSVEIQTKPINCPNTFIKVMRHDDLGEVKVSVVDRPMHGTTVSVYNLLKTFPVRRKRVKEVFDVEDIRRQLEALALIYHQVSFSLRNDTTGKVVLQTQRHPYISLTMAQLFDLPSTKRLIPITHAENDVEVKGFISKELHADVSLQFIFVNNRIIHSSKWYNLVRKLFNKYGGHWDHSRDDNASIIDAEGYIFVILISCPYSRATITRGTRKTSVDFRNSDQVIKCLQRAVRNVLKEDSHNSSVRHLPSVHETCSNELKMNGNPLFGQSQLTNIVRGQQVVRPICKSMADSRRNSDDMNNDLQQSIAKKRKKQIQSPDSSTVEKYQEEFFHESGVEGTGLAVGAPIFEIPDVPQASFHEFLAWLKVKASSSNEARKLLQEFLVYKSRGQTSEPSYPEPCLSMKKIRKEKLAARSSIVLNQSTHDIKKLNIFNCSKVSSGDDNNKQFFIRHYHSVTPSSENSFHTWRSHYQNDIHLDEANNYVKHAFVRTFDRYFTPKRPREPWLHPIQEEGILDELQAKKQKITELRDKFSSDIEMEKSISPILRQFPMEYDEFQCENLVKAPNSMEVRALRSTPVKKSFSIPEFCLNNLAQMRVEPPESLKSEDPPTLTGLDNLRESSPIQLDSKRDQIVQCEVLVANKAVQVNFKKQFESIALQVSINTYDKETQTTPKVFDMKETQATPKVFAVKETQATPKVFDVKQTQTTPKVFDTKETQAKPHMIDIATQFGLLSLVDRATSPIQISSDQTPLETNPIENSDTRRRFLAQLEKMVSNPSDLPCGQLTGSATNLQSSEESELPEVICIDDDDIEPESALVIADTVPAALQDWEVQTLSSGRIFYVHSKSGFTSFEPPTTSTRFSFSLASKPASVNSDQQSLPDLGKEELSELQNVILASTDNELEKIKWQSDETGDADKPSMNQLLLSHLSSGSDYSNLSVIASGEVPKTDIQIHSLITGFSFPKESLLDAKVIGQLDKKFIVVLLSRPGESNPCVVTLFDQHAVHERICLENLINKYQHAGKVSSEDLETPMFLVLPTATINIVLRQLIEFTSIGLLLSPADESSTIKVMAVPACFLRKQEREEKSYRKSSLERLTIELISEFAEYLCETRSAGVFIPKTVMDVIATEACRGAIKFNQSLTVERMGELLRQLSTCQLPFQCAHGRPSLVPVLDLANSQQKMETVARKLSYKKFKKRASFIQF